MSTTNTSPTTPPKPPAPPTSTGQAAPEAKTLTPEERKQLYAKLRERMSKSKLEIVAPAGMSAYWARKDDDTEMARLDYLGFRVVREIKGQPPRYKAQGAREDGTYVMGDVILMEISTEEYLFYKTENANRASQMASAAKNQFVEEAEKQGAPTFTVKRKA